MTGPRGAPSPPRAILALAVLAAGLVEPRTAAAQESVEPAVPVIVDEAGVLRWTATGDEVALFGVNYSAPFAHAYRALAYLGIDHRQAIDADVLHMARLGLDAYRIHVWDREVSDRKGNLLENDHLDLLDYLMARLAEHGIRVILTPIAWWGTGYPEADPDTNGLSDGWDKGEMTTDSIARTAQANYLRQFISHVNPYTGLAYTDDANLLAVEIINEPSHPGSPDETTRYIDAMASALRNAGFRKPIFYNISQNYRDEHGRAVCAAEIDGVSHQWYPTGLVRDGAVGGNMLPNVDRYTIPYEDFRECRDKARMVYEFDAADVAGSYMYPAMARSFRAAGFQWATQFAYDPLALAYANTEYQTHFLNLVYTPGKAISYMIAGAAFRTLPRGGSYGTYPDSEQFGSFRVSYGEDLSELVGDTVFFHSNSTATAPPQPSLLRRLAGVGTSAIVRYEGSGAWFLDRLDEGIWRLELYPDVAWVHDPFTRPSLAREAVRVVWRSRPMGIALPDLGEDFSIEPVDAGNEHRPTVRGGTFVARPGVYLLVRSDRRPGANPGDFEGAGARFRSFVAPASSDTAPTVLHTPPAELSAERPFTVRIDAVSSVPPDSVSLVFGRAWSPPRRFAMAPTGAFGYVAEVPADQVREGLAEYSVSVYFGAQARTFPGGEQGDPFRWDFTGRTRWEVPVLPAGSPVLLFDAKRDRRHLLVPHRWEYVRFRTDLVIGAEPGRLALTATVDDFSPSPRHFALRTFLPETERTRLAEVDARGAVLRIRARAPWGDGSARSAGASHHMEVALVEADGTAWGSVIALTDEWKEIVVPLSDLERTSLALLPRPFPQFLPYLMVVATDNERPRPSAIDGLQFVLRPDLNPATPSEGGRGFAIERVILEPAH